MELVWENYSQDDMNDIFNFLKEYHGEERAKELVKRVVSDIDILKTSPQLGKRMISSPQYRAAILGHYRVIYHFNSKKSIVTILGVFRTAYQGYEKRVNNIKLP